MSAWRWLTWLAVAVLLALAGCSGQVGVYRGPEPFGGKPYSIVPPRIESGRELLVVVLLLADERPAMDHELDWVRQANSLGNTTGQPKEVRNEFDRAIKAGLAAGQGIRIVSPEAFLKTREADLVISGRIHKCEAERKMGWSTADFHGRAAIDITLRNGRGKTLTSAPLSFSADAKKPWKPPTMDARVDEIPAGYAAAAVEEAIRRTVEAFLASPQLAAALNADHMEVNHDR